MLAKNVNDNAYYLVERAVLEFFASKLAPTCPGLLLAPRRERRDGVGQGAGRINLKCTALPDRIAPRSGHRRRIFVVKRGGS
ncbi:hypothetical protein FD951_09605 [Pseudomonas chlororaphis subsp. aurantiaca]|nr:hypothetical protein FD951_09605 [Pseudomonas chlororaphis subsp. aurantiaca]